MEDSSVLRLGGKLKVRIMNIDRNKINFNNITDKKLQN